MNFVDDILDVCSKAVDTAIDKTGEVIDYSKNRLDRSSLKVKIREKYQVLGKLCYDMTESGEDDMGTMKRIIADIRSPNLQSLKRTHCAVKKRKSARFVMQKILHHRHIVRSAGRNFKL